MGFFEGFPSKTLKDLVLRVPACFVNLSPSLPRPRRDGETPGISGDQSPKDPLYNILLRVIINCRPSTSSHATTRCSCQLCKYFVYRGPWLSQLWGEKGVEDKCICDRQGYVGAITLKRTFFGVCARVGLLSTPVRSSIKGGTNLRFVTIAESNCFV